MRAIIIAGGLSKRLRPHTDIIPKTLLPLNKRPILSYILDAIRAADIQHIDLLTGHGHDYVHNFMDLYAAQHPEVTFDTHFIDRYQDTGNIIALLAAEQLLDDPAIMINSDTIFHPDILRRLLDSPDEHAMVVDDVKDLGEEEMKVLVDSENRITKIHKTLDPASSHGEYIGVLKFSPSAKPALLKSTRALMAIDDSVYYEDAIQHMIDNAGVTVRAVSTGGLPAMEIDTEEDLAEAHKMVADISHD